MNKQQKQISRELFNMIYQWGKAGVVVDYNNELYKSLLGKFVGNKSNGFHKIGENQILVQCYIKDCKKKHLPF